MAITPITLAGNVKDRAGANVRTRACTVWLVACDANGVIERIADPDINEERYGNAKADVGDDGSYTFTNLWPTNAATNPTGYYYELFVLYPLSRGGNGRQANGGKELWRSGPFALTASANVADLDLDVPIVTATWRSAFADAMASIREDAADYAAAAAASAALADKYVVADLNTSDGQMQALVQSPSSLTGKALTTTFGARYATRRLGLTPGPVNLTYTAQGTTPSPIDVFDGYVWGYTGGTIYRSSDNGYTWSSYCASPNADRPGRIIPTKNGEVVASLATGIYLSTGWSTGTPTWTLKVAANGQARFYAFQVDGNGTKFIAAQYGPGSAGSQAWIDSRYAHISTDGGVTWTQVWDSAARFGTTEANNSHLHGACYDPWSDRFYLAEGHGATAGAIAGVYVSSDNGATWTRPVGLETQPPPTVMVPTDDGIVCGSDHAQAGVWGIVRQPDPSMETITRTWNWSAGVDGVIGFGMRGFRDPDTGVVYIGFQTSVGTVRPVIAGGTAATAGLVYTWPGSFVAVDMFYELVVSNGNLMSVGTFNGSNKYVLRGKLAAPGVARLDSGNAFGGDASGSSLALGPRSSVLGLRGAALGVAAVAGAGATSDRTVAVGHGASASASDATAVGALATAAGQGVAVGSSVTASGQSVIAGYGATDNGAVQATAVGGNASARASSVAIGYNSSVASGVSQVVAIGNGAAAATGATGAVGVGYQAKVNAFNGVAIGNGATVAATHNRAVALGQGVTTTDADQVAIGSKYFELLERTTAPISPAADGARLYVEDNGAGKSRLVVKFNTGGGIVIATQP